MESVSPSITKHNIVVKCDGERVLTPQGWRLYTPTPRSCIGAVLMQGNSVLEPNHLLKEANDGEEVHRHL